VFHDVKGSGAAEEGGGGCHALWGGKELWHQHLICPHPPICVLTLPLKGSGAAGEVGEGFL
jgi:hypothetical protein